MLELRHPLAKIEGVKPPEGHTAELRKCSKESQRKTEVERLFGREQPWIPGLEGI
jgi:hypothetical protein